MLPLPLAMRLLSHISNRWKNSARLVGPNLKTTMKILRKGQVPMTEIPMFETIFITSVFLMPLN